MLNESQLVIFSNFKVDDYMRLEHLKYSLESMKPFYNNLWCLNIRGSLKYKVSDLIRKTIPNSQITYIQSNKGWMIDSKNIIENIHFKHLFYWVEDHVLISSNNHTKEIITNISELNIDYMPTSWWSEKRYSIQYDQINFKEYNYTKVATIKVIHLEFLKANGLGFLNSLTGIYSKDYFLKIVNIVLRKKNKWPKSFPFDIERTIQDQDVLPQKLLIPKVEFCACIDDDHFEEGYSLVSRGVVPNLGKRKASTETHSIRWYFRIKKVIFLIQQILTKFKKY